MSKLVKINLLICAFLAPFAINSCASSSKHIERGTAAPFNSVLTNGNNRHPGIIRLLDSKDRFFCTGFVIDGIYAMTAAHCVSKEFGFIPAEQIKIHDAYGIYVGDATLVALDKDQDIAFIKGDFIEFKPMSVDFNGKNSFRNMNLISCGFPAGSPIMYCTQLTHIGNRNFLYRTVGGPIYQGMSGGPVVEVVSGNVIGVNSGVDMGSVLIGPVIGGLERVGLK